MLFLYVAVYFLSSCVANVHLEGCSSNHDIVIVIDSTKLTTQTDFGAQKVFVDLLYAELRAIANISLTVQVYSNPKTCSDLVREHNRAFRSNDNKEIRQKLDSLNHDNESATEYDLNCVKKFINTLLAANKNKDGSDNKGSDTSSLILAKYDSVKDAIGDRHYLKKESSNDYLAFFLTTNGKPYEPPFILKISDIQSFVPIIKKLICGEKSTTAPPGMLSSGRVTTFIASSVIPSSSANPSNTTIVIRNTTLEKHHKLASVGVSNSTSRISQVPSMFTQLPLLTIATTRIYTDTPSAILKSDFIINNVSISSSETLVLQTKTFNHSVIFNVTPSSPAVDISKRTEYSLMINATASQILVPLQTTLTYPSSSVLRRFSTMSPINRTSISIKWNSSIVTSLPLNSSLPSSSMINGTGAGIISGILSTPTTNISATVIATASATANNTASSTNITTPTTKFIEFSSSLSSQLISASMSSTAVLKSSIVTTVNMTSNNKTFIVEPRKSSSMILTNQSATIFNATGSSIFLNNATTNASSLFISPSFSSRPSNVSPVLPTMKINSTGLIFNNSASMLSTIAYNMSSSVKITPPFANKTASNSTTFNTTTISNATLLVLKPTIFNVTSSSLFNTVQMTSSVISSVFYATTNSTALPPLYGNHTVSSTTSSLFFLHTSSFLNNSNLSNVSMVAKTQMPSKKSTLLFATSIASTKSIMASISTAVVLLPVPTTTSVDVIETSNATVPTPMTSAIKWWIVSTSILNESATSSVIPTPTSTVIVSNTSLVVPIISENTLEKDLRNFQEQQISDESFKDSTWLKTFVQNASDIMEKISTDNSTEILTASLSLMKYMENILLKVGKRMRTRKERIHTSKGLSIEVQSVDPKNFNGYQFSENEVENEVIVLPNNIFPKDYDTSTATIVVMSYSPLPVMRPSSNNIEVADKVFVILVDPPIPAPFKEPFNYTMSLQTTGNTKVSCVYWNESDWITPGCRTFLSKDSVVTCQCDHMTPFSVLMQVNEFEIPEEHIFALSMITYIGCGLSIFGCIVLILAFMMCGKLVKIDRNLIHINLAIAIALSNGLFIVADSVYKYKHICLGVSIAMLYSFLASFFWMFVEGMHVYLMVVKVFHSSRKMKVYMLIGWVVPAIIVTLASLKFHEDFIRPNFCWITTDRSLIWIFVGPALLVLSVNTVILIASLSASHKMCIDEIEFNRLRKIARLTLVLMPIFGLSWVFGVLAVNKELLIFQYIFTGLNSFQGVFLFVCYCLMNSEVKREYQRVRRRSQFSSKSNGLADSGFSSYVQYQRGKPARSSALSAEDVPSNVYLTKFDINGDFMTYEEDPDAEYPESVSNTLTKKTHKKNYSIELLRLPKTVGGGSDDEESYEDGDATGLLTLNGGQALYRSSSFHSNISKYNGSTIQYDDLDQDGAIYKTFQNTNDGTFVTAYQV